MTRLLQICNVGKILGGTAACAWTLTRACPELQHQVWFLTPPDAETVRTFAPVPVSHFPCVTQALLDDLQPDVIVLHNLSARKLDADWPAPTLQYLHSETTHPAAADRTACCSQWLARRLGLPEDRVLWQGVRKIWPRRSAIGKDHARLIVGRICSPQRRKWPADIIPWYAQLSARCRFVDWEFVGCPAEMQRELCAACRGRAVFHPAGWSQLDRLGTWDVLLYSHPALAETFGRIVAEALRAGCIPVVDRLGGFCEQVPEDGGFLCSSTDEFASALVTLRCPSIRAERSARCEVHGDAWFSEQQFAGRVAKFLPMIGPSVVRWSPDHAQNS